MSQPTPPHKGKLYEPDSLFFVRWMEGKFSALYYLPGPRRSPRGHNTQTPIRDEWIEFFFGNCDACGSCGPVYLDCECGGSYVYHRVMTNDTDLHHDVHPILWAHEANKPCRLPNNSVEFGEMFLEQKFAPRPTGEAPFSDMHCMPTLEWMEYTLENRQNMQRDISRTHEMEYIDNPYIINDEMPYAIIRRIE